MRKKEGVFKHFDFILWDAFALLVSFHLAYFFQFHIKDIHAQHSGWLTLAVMMVLLNTCVALFSDCYREILRRGWIKELVSLVQQETITYLLITFYLYITHTGAYYSRTVILISGVLFLLLNYGLRQFWKEVLRRTLRKKPYRYVIVGSGEYVQTVQSAMKEDATARYILVKQLDLKTAPISELESVLAKQSVHEVIIIQDDVPILRETAYLCEKYGCHVRVVPQYQDILSSNARLEQIGDLKAFNFRASPLDSLSNRLVKRVFDLLLSLVAILLTSPLMLIAAIGTRLSSPGPILFRQERIGKDCQSFTMLKFRSMRITGTENTGWSAQSDPRKTRFGSWIRKLSIDELPQFFNVLKGDMSIIGPRPEVPFHVQHFKEEIPMYLVRQQVKPGITGWAQIHGLRGDTDIAERVRYDIWYIENWSLGLDLKIALRTVFGGMINSENVG